MKNSNMPAMPLAESIDIAMPWDELTAGGRFLPAHGLTKREKFALEAMNGLLASASNSNGEWTNDGAENIAKEAVFFADALLEALENE